MAGFVTFRRSERLKLSGIRPLPLNCGHSEDFCWAGQSDGNREVQGLSTQHASRVGAESGE